MHRLQTEFWTGGGGRVGLSGIPRSEPGESSEGGGHGRLSKGLSQVKAKCKRKRGVDEESKLIVFKVSENGTIFGSTHNLSHYLETEGEGVFIWLKLERDPLST